jgi:ankyrin repeat protein
MRSTEFLDLVTRSDDDTQAISEVQRDPQLAMARNAEGVSVICVAVYRRKLPLAAALAEQRRDLDLFEATCLGDLPRVSELLASHPEQVNSVSPDGFSPLGYSAFFGHVAVMQELLRHGAQVNEASRNGMRVCPLHSAAASRDEQQAVALTRLLLAAGANANTQQQGGYTALHEAAMHGKLGLLELLLEHGADPQLANDKSQRPIDLARASGHAQAQTLLERALSLRR